MHERARCIANSAADIQPLLDIGNHILASHFGVSAREYEEIARGLGQRGVLSRELVERLRGLGGFRNLLAHGYMEVDPDKVYDALQRSVADFTDFQREVDGWLATLERGPA